MSESITQHKNPLHKSPLRTDSRHTNPDDHPLEERKPAAPFAIVGWSYLLVLAIMTLFIAVSVWLTR
ncbi:hypothetical protein [Rhodopirellula sp. MGV]|uniref:hypothetical protein n=1 Tax=Rhodopirellula sp. MGV TaxID=2023130 RepID=UPI000B97B279|nr:hypothetical protein [Rhodopirellula sp. MGV]OYP37729.1 hypothetical protein CGZ80_04405 [Rhodopirellula sp. MGV]PNY37167.1 hypothetical protein C2E31_09260 [Rhodopirellula baltica]